MIAEEKCCNVDRTRVREELFLTTGGGLNAGVDTRDPASGEGMTQAWRCPKPRQRRGQEARVFQLQRHDPCIRLSRQKRDGAMWLQLPAA